MCETVAGRCVRLEYWLVTEAKEQSFNLATYKLRAYDDNLIKSMGIE